MGNTSNKVAWLVFAIMAIGVGLYPLMYAVVDGKYGLLFSKSDELLESVIWNIGFYGHISFGGLALLTGWAQFSKKLRSNYLNIHRNLGKFYVICALISGVCGIGISFFATGGWIAALGFFCLGIFWVFTTSKAYLAIRSKDVALHEGMMIYSYAACFGAVTLRIWLPLLTIAFGEFIIAYRIVAWLAWVPNVIFAYFWVRKRGILLG
ncbi:MAG: DUF2306 domain-containing protein [Croceitalea sp.]|nr:DUF2306 domain-containing protein [Croceitalea sp.]NNL09019.1 DUF2306 domain-containing protein [Croceitalea sp.]NNM18746.1 DUF2306 domain-containing protein [Croceitalea sp.]